MKFLEVNYASALFISGTLAIVSLNSVQAASSQTPSVDWSQLKEDKASYQGQKVKMKGYLHEQKGEMYLTAMASGACCSSDSCENKVHLIGVKDSLANVDPQKPVTLEGSVPESGHVCCQEEDHHSHDKELAEHESCSGCLGEKNGGCCALIDMEDPYLVDDDGASRTYSAGVIASILLGVASVFGYQMLRSKKK